MHRSASTIAALGLSTLALSIALNGAIAQHHHPSPPAESGPVKPQGGGGLYDLGVKLTGTDGKPIDLAKLKGQPALVTMFFASCPDVCPLMTEQIARVVRSLSSAEQERLHVVLVSFDERDTPADLAIYREIHGIESPNWLVAGASAPASKALAAELDIAFEKAPSGTYAHRAMVGIVAADGRILARVPAAGVPSDEFKAALHTVLAGPIP